jgi:hypothetical protein
LIVVGDGGGWRCRRSVHLEGIINWQDDLEKKLKKNHR